MRPPRADPDVQAHGAVGALRSAAPVDRRWRPRPLHPGLAGDTHPGPFQLSQSAGAGPSRFPRSQDNKRQLFPLCEGHGAGTRHPAGRSATIPHPQSEFGKGVCARAKFGLNPAGREFPEVLGVQDILGASGEDTTERKSHGGPKVEALTCSCGSRTRGQGGVPGFSPRPSQLPDPIVSGSRLLATGPAAPWLRPRPAVLGGAGFWQASR